MNSFFDDFLSADIEEPVVEAPKAKPAAKKDDKQKADKKAKPVVKTTSTAAKLFKLPVKVMYLPGQVVTVEGSGEVKADELARKLAEIVPGYIPEILNNFVKNGDSFIPVGSPYIYKAKGTSKENVTVSTGPSFENRTEFLTSGEEEVDIASNIKAYKAMIGKEFKNVPVCCAIAKKKDKTSAIDMKFVVDSTDASIIELPAELGEQIVLVLPTMEEKLMIGGGGALMKEIAELLDCDMVNLRVVKLAENRYFVCFKQKADGYQAPEAKEETYPTDGYTISLTFREYPISPADFGGKAEVKKEDITRFLLEKGHRDYAIAEYSIDKYDKEKLLICTIRGSKKGSLSHPLFDVSASSVSLELGVARIPIDAFNFFIEMAQKAPEKEMMLELFYEPNAKKYLFLYPVQQRTAYSVETTADAFFENTRLSGLIKVGEVHSHGKLEPFFSSTDDEDEKYKPGLYCVVGRANKAHPKLKARFSYGNGMFERVTIRKLLEEFCTSDPSGFVNDAAYMQCLTKPINRRLVRFGTQIPDNGFAMEIGVHEKETLSAVPGLFIRQVVVEDQICNVAALRGRTVELESPWAEGFMDMYLHSVSLGEGTYEIAV